MTCHGVDCPARFLGIAESKCTCGFYKFGAEQDDTIAVEITDASVLQCFRVKLGGITVRMHARSLVDLIHKLQVAHLDWIKYNVMAALEKNEQTRAR